MPELLCNSCTGACGLLIKSIFCREYFFAVADEKPVPDRCDFFKEDCYHGIEGVRP